MKKLIESVNELHFINALTSEGALKLVRLDEVLNLIHKFIEKGSDVSSMIIPHIDLVNRLEQFETTFYRIDTLIFNSSDKEMVEELQQIANQFEESMTAIRSFIDNYAISKTIN